MKQNIPEELNEYLGTTPKAIHSAYYMDFADGYNKIKDLLYRPCNMDEVNERDELINELKESVNNAYVQLTTVGLYWQFCTFKVFKETYESRKEEYFKTFFDATENDFIDEELFNVNDFSNEVVEYIDETGYPRESDTPILYELLNNINYKNVQFSQSKKEKFLTEQKKNLHIDSQIVHKTVLKWNGNKVDLIELIEALVLNGNLDCEAKGDKEKLFKDIGEIFDLDLKNFAQTISQFKIRNEDNHTKFLNKLKTTLNNSIVQKYDRNRN